MIKADAVIHGEIRPAGVVGGSAQSGAKVDGDIRQTLLKGEKGDKGDTPVITAKRSDHIITIYVDGAEIAKLTDGEDGNTPIITAERSGADVTVYVDGTVIATLHDGVKGDKGDGYVLTQADKEEIAGMVDVPDVPVTDVQVNGTSILEEGVANIPIASFYDAGVIKAGGNYGIKINSSGYAVLNTPTETLCKTGTNTFIALMPSVQHAAAFYGLAKAAGDTTQSASSNRVGTYTDEAQTAIRTMLGLEEVYQDYSSALTALGVI